MIVVEPRTFEMDSREDLVLTFDASAETASIDAVGTPELIRISNGVNYTAGLRGSPAFAGPLISQEVYLLEPGERYWLILPFTSDDEVFAPRLELICPVG